MELSSIIANINSNFNKTAVCVCAYTFDSPVGRVTCAADEIFLYIVNFDDSKSIVKNFQMLFIELSCHFLEKKNKILERFEAELTDYFDGKLKRFTIPIKTIGSEFQKEVWKKLLELPFGSTQTYGDIAKALSRPASHSRAVGAACGANKHLLVIPCHRIVASGSKGGFTVGVDRKEWLIEHEKKYA